jgi:phosphotransferase system  glucose/maltose/N-acetylglucosamine-specific IIC component
MARIDFWSLILGVLLSIVGAGIYDYVFYLLQGPIKTAEIQSSFWATIITSIIFVGYLIFFYYLIKKKGNKKDH